MDSTTVIQVPRDETAARNRFENFKLGKGLPSTIANPAAGSRHGHARSHSRNKSISNSLSLSSSTNMNDMASFSFPMSNSTPAISTTDTLPLPPRPLSQPVISPNPGPPPKRASHHRRRSSVSTRRESAELMGITLPDLPASASEDNVNLGEKDSIRRRALWALEGKPDVSFNKVEIPELATPDMEKLMFDFPTKQSIISTGSSCSFGSSGIGSKRDSFKLLGPSSCSKDQLHTLLEEEEEEEEEDELEETTEDVHLTSTTENPTSAADQSSKENIPPSTPAVAVTKATPSKPRPATLNLRPLALTPEALSTAVQGLPTPTTTPSPRSGLRPLSLTSNGSDSSETTKQERRSSLVISPSPVSRRPILNLSTENLVTPPNKSEDEKKSGRRSSISYKRSSYNGAINNIAGLPTPEMTPTFGRRYSNAEYSGVHTGPQMTPSSISDDEFFPNPPTQSRPLSTSEQHFLFKSHHALVARISELERALSVLRRRESGGYAISNSGSSRPQSMVSDSSVLAGSDVGSEPVSDEMLQLISDLKAERDELMKDMDGWRQRVADLENQNGILAKRVDNERREAWVARSRTGILEHEKDVLAKKLISVEELLKSTSEEKLQLGTENDTLKADKNNMADRIAQLEAQVKGLQDDLAIERKAKEDALSTPRAGDGPVGFGRYAVKHGMGLPSLDSESSATDVESSDEGHIFGFTLKSVQEEDEDNFSDEDGLAGYEDEDEEDTNMSLQSSSSFESEEDGPYPPRIGASDVFSTPPRIFSKPAPNPRTWTFPKAQTPRAPIVQSPEKEDRFFGCLDDDSETAGSVPSSPSQYSYEKSKGMFAQGFKYAEDDDAAFFVPIGLGLPVHDEQDGSDCVDGSLATVSNSNDFESDTDVDETSMFGQMGGITITFTPPQEEPVLEEREQLQVSPTKRTSPPPTLPALDFGNVEEDDDQTVDAPFSFGTLFDEKTAPPIPELAPDNPVGPPSPLSADIAPVFPRPTSPSMIPRPASPSVVRFSPPSSPSSRSSTPESPQIPCKTLNNTSLFTEPSILDGPSYATPPARRAIAAPSFIPQPVSSPSPIRTLPIISKPRLSSVPPTFIRQPTRVPLLPTSAPKASAQPASKKTNGSTMIPQTSPLLPVESSSMNLPSLSRFSNNDATFGHTATPVVNTPAGQLHTKSNGPSQNSHSTSQMISPPMSQASARTSSALPPAASSRLSFQTLTSFISPWSARPTPASAPVDLPAAVVKRDAFVPRDQQLRKLKARLDIEGKNALAHSAHLQCCNCKQKVVVI